MRSIDWKEYRYCEYWVHNSYLFDPYGISLYGMALCQWCWDFILVDGGTAESTEHWWCFYQCQLREQQRQLRERQRQLCRARCLQNLRVLPVALQIDTIIHMISSY